VTQPRHFPGDTPCVTFRSSPRSCPRSSRSRRSSRCPQASPPARTADGDDDDDCDHPGNVDPPNKIKNLKKFCNPDGKHATFSTRDGKWLQTSNPFFAKLGTNNRTCETCHGAEDGWSFSLASARARFDRSHGHDPLFEFDGQNAPGLDNSTEEARRAASSLLLEHGVIRINIPLPAVRNFDLIAVDDPTGNVTSIDTQTITVFRRPLPSMNLKFNNMIMWDGREPNLASQANNATLGHAQGAASLSQAQLDEIVAFETALFTAQVQSNVAGKVDKHGATGGPVTLVDAPFFLDMNRAPACPPGVPPGTNGCRRFAVDIADENVFTIFDGWVDSSNVDRASVARGQDIFNHHPMINPDTGAPNRCSNCHNGFNSGGGTFSIPPPPFGVTASVRASNPEFRPAGMPVYTFRQRTAPFTVRQSTDPGRALITGQFAQMNSFKSPHLRGVAARAPFFHNGMSKTLADVVDHYDVLFQMNLTPQQRTDLIAFLGSI
jgi:hypothetical protein